MPYRFRFLPKRLQPLTFQWPWAQPVVLGPIQGEAELLAPESEIAATGNVVSPISGTGEVVDRQEAFLTAVGVIATAEWERQEEEWLLGLTDYGIKAETVTEVDFPKGTEEELLKLEAKLEKIATDILAAQQKQVMAALSSKLGVKAPSDDEADNLINWEQSDTTMADGYMPIIREIASYGAMAAAKALEVVSITVDMDMVNKPVLEWSRKYTYDLVKGLNETTRGSLRQAMIDFQEGKLGGRGMPDLVKALEPIFGYERAQVIATTETTRAFSQGSLISWKKSGAVVSKVWKTSMDDRVCIFCNQLNETVLSLTEEFVATGSQSATSKTVTLRSELPPLHVSCRCRAVARMSSKVP